MVLHDAGGETEIWLNAFTDRITVFGRGGKVTFLRGETVRHFGVFGPCDIHVGDLLILNLNTLGDVTINGTHVKDLKPAVLTPPAP